MMSRHMAFAILWVALASLIGVPAAASVSALDGFNPGAEDTIESLLVQPDGKILACGYFTDIGGGSCNGFARLTPDGRFDTAFKIGTGAGGWYPYVGALALQHDGKILAGGYFNSFDGVSAQNLVRLNADGSVDKSFVYTAGGPVTCVAIRPDGKMLVAGTLEYEGGVRRLVLINADGSLDTTFEYNQDPNFKFHRVAILADGKLLLDGKKKLNADGTEDASYHLGFPVPLEVHAMTVQPDGKILLGGPFSVQIGDQACHSIARIDDDGSLDPAFNPGSGADEYQDVCAIAALPDGRIMAGGPFSVFNGANTYGLVLLNRDGSVGKTYPGLDDRTCAIAVQPDGNVVIGGNFESLDGTPRNHIARLNRDGLLDANFNSGSGTNEVVRAIVRQPDGTTIIAGNFTRVFGVECNRVARLDDKGALDTSFNAGDGPNGIVYALAGQSDGRIIVAGDFTIVAGSPRSYVARLNADGSLDDTFHPGRIDRAVTALALQPDGRLLIGGRFSKINGNPRRGIARLKANGSLDPDFIPATESGSDVYALAVLAGGKILAGGYRLFTRLNGDGSIDRSFTPEAACDLTRAISVLADGRILVAGDAFVNGGWNNGVVFKLNADGALAPGFDFQKQLYQQIMTLAPRPDGKILIGGDFTTINGVNCNRVALLNSTGSLDTSFNPGSGADGVVHVIAAQSDNKAMIAGNFNSVNGEDRSKLARLNADGTVDNTYNSSGSGANGAGFAIAYQTDERLFLGGAFTAINNVSRKHVSRLGYDGWFDPDFPAGAATNGNVFCAAAQADGKTIIGGVFTGVNGTTQNRIARLNADGMIDAAFKTGSGADDTIFSIATQPDGKIVIGGDFTQFNGAGRGRIARLNRDGSLDASFKPGQFDQRVGAIALQRDGRIVACGRFLKSGSTQCGHIARLNANGSIDAAFTSKASIDNRPEAVVIQPDGKIVVAGQFNLVNGATRVNIARLNPDGSLDTSFDARINADQGGIHALALQADGHILIGGDFLSINLVARNRLARLNPDGSLDKSYDPGTGANGVVDAIALAPDGKLLMGGDFMSFNGVKRNHIARITNPTAASQTLTLSGNEAITWSLGGSFPQPHQVLFEHSYDGLFWEELGWGTAVPGVGYQLADIRLPARMNHYVRATGYVTGGLGNGSVSLVRSTLLAYVTPSRNAAREWLHYK